MKDVATGVDFGAVLAEIHEQVCGEADWGVVHDGIPALARESKEQLGIVLAHRGGGSWSVGDTSPPRSIQSISKVFTLALALELTGDSIWERVGREPSGTAFNSLVQLESEAGIPRNPLINAGALVVTDHLLTRLHDVPRATLELLQRCAGTTAIQSVRKTALSELAASDRNRALLYYLFSFGNLANQPESVLECYVENCAVAMTLEQLASAFLVLVRAGEADDGTRILSARTVKRLHALLLTCGVYDSAGDFAYRVGLPAKSGVGGCIVAVLPGEWAVATYSPGLDASGNSKAGVRALELLTSRLGASIF